MSSITVLTWNVFHGRDFPPDPGLRTMRSKLLRVSERGESFAQVNRDLFEHFASLIAGWDWDIALLQECPPHWEAPLAERAGATTHRVLTSRNSLARLRRLGAAINPDLIGSNEGGSNLTLVRGEIAERRDLVVCPGPKPERRALAFTRLATGICIANTHLSTGAARRSFAASELRLAAETCGRWAAGAPLILGGDLNLRPRQTAVFAELADRHGLEGTTAPDSIDHLLSHGMRAVEPPAALAPQAREVDWRDGLRLRLSDHAPVRTVLSAAAG